MSSKGKPKSGQIVITPIVKLISNTGWQVFDSKGNLYFSSRGYVHTHSFQYDGRSYEFTPSDDQIDIAGELIAGEISESDFMQLNLLFDPQTVKEYSYVGLDFADGGSAQ
jgi:hypothetical protein